MDALEFSWLASVRKNMETYMVENILTRKMVALGMR
jgi:hypothetical protein